MVILAIKEFETVMCKGSTYRYAYLAKLASYRKNTFDFRLKDFKVH